MQHAIEIRLDRSVEPPAILQHVHIHKVIREPDHLGRRRADLVERLVVDLLAFRRIHHLEQIGAEQNAGERIAEIVRDHAQPFGFFLINPRETVAGFLQLGLDQAALLQLGREAAVAQKQEEENEHGRRGDARGDPEGHHPPTVLPDIDGDPAIVDRLALQRREVGDSLVHDAREFRPVLADAEENFRRRGDHAAEPEIAQPVLLDEIGGVGHIADGGKHLAASDRFVARKRVVVFHHLVPGRVLVQVVAQTGVTPGHTDGAPGQIAQIEEIR